MLAVMAISLPVLKCGIKWINAIIGEVVDRALVGNFKLRNSQDGVITRVVRELLVATVLVGRFQSVVLLNLATWSLTHLPRAPVRMGWRALYNIAVGSIERSHVRVHIKG